MSLGTMTAPSEGHCLLFPVSQDEGAVISKISEIPNRDGHATDEEKLASTSSCAQKSAGAGVKGEPGEDPEYCERTTDVPSLP